MEILSANAYKCDCGNVGEITYSDSPYDSYQGECLACGFDFCIHADAFEANLPHTLIQVLMYGEVDDDIMLNIKNDSNGEIITNAEAKDVRANMEELHDYIVIDFITNRTTRIAEVKLMR